MAVFTSYDLKGEKKSFANWISMITPQDTPFVSMTGKEATQNKIFNWQTDKLADAVTTNKHVEGSVVTFAALGSTELLSNVTQILRKSVEVTDTADEIDTYGRAKELAYQMEKAGKELKRDLEKTLLTAQVKVDTAGQARETACFEALVSTEAIPGHADKKVVIKSGVVGGVTEAKLFELTKNLYLAGSEANIIMFHPDQADFFASLMEKAPAGSARARMFDGMDTKFNKYVATLVDPLGQEFKLIPNRFMPANRVHIFNPSDFTQMVLREPQQIKLSKVGSSERRVIEMEVGLRLRNSFAAGILQLAA